MNLIVNDDSIQFLSNESSGKSIDYYQKKCTELSSKLNQTIKINTTLCQILENSHQRNLEMDEKLQILRNDIQTDYVNINGSCIFNKNNKTQNLLKQN